MLVVRGLPFVSPSLYHHHHQYDQIGQFLKAVGNKFAHKISPKIGDFWGYFV